MNQYFKISHVLLLLSVLLCSVGCSDNIKPGDLALSPDSRNAGFVREVTTLDGTTLQFEYTVEEGLCVRYYEEGQVKNFTELPMLKDNNGQQISLENLPYDIASIVVEDGKWEVDKLRQGLKFLGIRIKGGGRGERPKRRLDNFRRQIAESRQQVEKYCDTQLGYISDTKQPKSERRKVLNDLFCFINSSDLKEDTKAKRRTDAVMAYMLSLVMDSTHTDYPNLRAMTSERERGMTRFLDITPQDIDVLNKWETSFDIEKNPDDSKLTAFFNAFMHSRVLYHVYHTEHSHSGTLALNDFQRKYVDTMKQCISCLYRHYEFIRAYCVFLKRLHKQEGTSSEREEFVLYMMHFAYLDTICYGIDISKRYIIKK